MDEYEVSEEIDESEKEEIEELSSGIAMAHLSSNSSFKALPRPRLQKPFKGKVINEDFSDDDDESVSDENEDQEDYNDLR